MNIPSASCSQMPPAASATEAQGKAASLPGRVESVKPEVKSFVAEDNKGRVHNKARMRKRKARDFDVLAVNFRVDPSRPKGRKTLFGICTMRHLPSDGLAKLMEEIRVAEENITKPGVKQKLVALKLQELIMGRFIARYDDAMLLEINQRIDSLIDGLDSEQQDGQDIKAVDSHIVTDPEVLWFNQPDFIRTQGYVDTNPDSTNVYIPEVCALISRKRKKLGTINYFIGEIKKILESGEENNDKIKEFAGKIIKAMGGWIFHAEQVPPRARASLPDIDYICLDRSIVAMMDELMPGRCADAAKYGLVIIPDDRYTANSFERKLFACYQLYRENTENSVCQPANLGRIDLLNRYKDQIKYKIETTEIEDIRAQQLVFLWCYSLFRFAHQCLECLCISIGSESENFARINECIELIEWAQQNNFFDAVDCLSVSRPGDNAARQLGKSADSAVKNLLGMVECGIRIARNDQLRPAYAAFLSASEMICDQKGFDYAMEIVSKHTLLPVLIRVWHDLGMEVEHSHRVLSGSPRPEHAIECLVKLKQKREKLSEIGLHIDNIAERIKTSSKGQEQLPQITRLASRIALYYFLVEDEEKGKAILPYGYVKSHTFFLFLSSIANEQFEGAIKLMEAALGKNAQGITNDEEFIALQHAETHIMPLLGLLHKKLAENQGCDNEKRTRHLSLALSCLTGQVSTRKELYLPMAEIQKKLDKFQDAYNSCDELCRWLVAFPEQSYENCQYYCAMWVRTRVDKARKKDEKVSDDKNPAPVAGKSGVFEIETTGVLTEDVVGERVRASRAEFYELYDELLFSVNIDYDKLLARYDDFYESVDDITFKLAIINNKVRTWRCKTFDVAVLEDESTQTGVPVTKIKIDLRKRMIDALYSSIKSTLMFLTSEEPNKGWKSYPFIIFNDRFRQVRESKKFDQYFWDEFADQFMTLARILEDMCWDIPEDEEMKAYRREVVDTKQRGNRLPKHLKKVGMKIGSGIIDKTAGEQPIKSCGSFRDDSQPHNLFLFHQQAHDMK